MSQEQKKRHRRSDAEIRQLVSEFVESGMSRQQFAELHGVSVSTIDNWRQRGRKLSDGLSNKPPRLDGGGAAVSEQPRRRG